MIFFGFEIYWIGWDSSYTCCLVSLYVVGWAWASIYWICFSGFLTSIYFVCKISGWDSIFWVVDASIYFVLGTCIYLVWGLKIWVFGWVSDSI